MILKSFFALALTVSAFTTIAQDMDSRTELAETCLTVPTTLSADAPNAFEFELDFECSFTNFVLTVKNSDGVVVYESKDIHSNWSAASADIVAGTYNWTLIGTTGTTVAYEHVKKLGVVEVVK